jgi:hypothetical protein
VVQQLRHETVVHDTRERPQNRGKMQLRIAKKSYTSCDLAVVRVDRVNRHPHDVTTIKECSKNVRYV